MCRLYFYVDILSILLYSKTSLEILVFIIFLTFIGHALDVQGIQKSQLTFNLYKELFIHTVYDESMLVYSSFIFYQKTPFQYDRRITLYFVKCCINRVVVNN